MLSVRVQLGVSTGTAPVNACYDRGGFVLRCPFNVLTTVVGVINGRTIAPSIAVFKNGVSCRLTPWDRSSGKHKAYVVVASSTVFVVGFGTPWRRSWGKAYVVHNRCLSMLFVVDLRHGVARRVKHT